MEIVTRVKKWGNSLGLIIPKQAVEKLGLKEEEEIVVNINGSGRSDALKKGWGLCRGDKKTAQEWKDEFRRTLCREHQVFL